MTSKEIVNPYKTKYVSQLGIQEQEQRKERERLQAAGAWPVSEGGFLYDNTYAVELQRQRQEAAVFEERCAANARWMRQFELQVCDPPNSTHMHCPHRFDDIYCRLFLGECESGVVYTIRIDTGKSCHPDDTHEGVVKAVEEEYGDQWDRYVKTIDGNQAIIDGRREERRVFRQKELVRNRRKQERMRKKRIEEQKKREREEFFARQRENGWPMSFEEAFPIDPTFLEKVHRDSMAAADEAIAERDKKIARQVAANQKRKETRERNKRKAAMEKVNPTSKSNQRMERFLKCNGDHFLCGDSPIEDYAPRNITNSNERPSETTTTKNANPPGKKDKKERKKGCNTKQKPKKATWKRPIPSWVIVKSKPTTSDDNIGRQNA